MEAIESMEATKITFIELQTPASELNRIEAK